MSEGQNEISPRTLLFKTLIFSAITIGAIILITVILGLFIDFKALGKWISQTLGWPGIFAYCWIIDSFPMPGSPLFIFPFTQTWDPVPLISVMACGSLLGGTTAYFIGRFLYKWGPVKKIASAWREKESSLAERYGFWALAVAAVTPLPFSAVCIAAGMMKMKASSFALGILFRIPKLIFFWWAITSGIGLFAKA